MSEATPRPWTFVPEGDEGWAHINDANGNYVDRDEDAFLQTVVHAVNNIDRIADLNAEVARVEHERNYHFNVAEQLAANVRTLTAERDGLRRALQELMDCSRAVVGADPQDSRAQEALDMFWESRKRARAALSVSDANREPATLPVASDNGPSG